MEWERYTSLDFKFDDWLKNRNARKLVSNDYKVFHSNAVYGSKRHITFTPIFKFNVGTTYTLQFDLATILVLFSKDVKPYLNAKIGKNNLDK